MLRQGSGEACNRDCKGPGHRPITRAHLTGSIRVVIDGSQIPRSVPYIVVLRIRIETRGVFGEDHIGSVEARYGYPELLTQLFHAVTGPHGPLFASVTLET